MTPYERKITLRAEDLGCDRAGAPVVRGVSFVLEPGSAIQLFGANGSGKTSLLNLFASHIHAAEGTASWRRGDGEWQSDRPEGAVFFLGHEPSVKPALSARENLTFWARLYGVSKNAAGSLVDGALDRMGMAEHGDKRAGRLSAGQRRRIDVARALLVQRAVWLLDEPAAAVDADGADIIASVISTHLGNGGIAIIATHDDLKFASRKLVIG